MQSTTGQSTTGLSANEKQELLQLLLAGKGIQQAAAPQKTIPRRSEDKPAPLSFAQQRIWFLEQFEPGTTAYHIPLAVHVAGDFDEGAFQAAITEIVHRHQSLRTTFETGDSNSSGIPHQRVTPVDQCRVEVPLTDLSQLSATAREAEVQGIALAEAQKPFVLNRGPLLRVRVLRLGAAEHVVLVTMHHIVSDGWSIGLFLHEVQTLYSAFQAQQPPSLPDLTLQYADYASWQQGWLQGETLDAQLDYWRDALAMAPDQIALPFDRPHGHDLPFEACELPISLEGDLLVKLRQLCRAADCTLFMGLLAGFGLLLYRYTEESDIVVGTPIANRNRRELEPLIGFFTNTLALPLAVKQTQSFADLLGHVREVVLEGQQHQDLPFEKLVEAISPDRVLGRSPIFQVMLAMQTLPFEQFSLPGLTLTLQEVELPTAKYDLSLLLWEMSDRVKGQVKFNRALFDIETIERLIEHLLRVLQSVCDNPQQPIAQIDLLTPAERKQLLADWNDTATPYPQTQCVHQLFEQQALRTPHNQAVVYEDVALTYQELDEAANRLAASLAKQGIVIESRVGICIARSNEMIVTLLAIMKAGAVCVPLDITYPPERLHYMITDSQLALVVVDPQVAHLIAAYDVATYEIAIQQFAPATVADQHTTDVDAPRPSFAPPPIYPENAAYIVYTSGSTGRPKGVLMPHRTLSNLAYWQANHPPLRAGKRRVQIASLSFDVSFREIFASLLSGGTLFMIPEATREEPVVLARFIHKNQIEKLLAPYVALEQLAEAFRMMQVYPTSLCEIISSGEQLKVTPSIIELLGHLPNCQLHNHYGPSETHMVIGYDFTGPSEDWDELPPIGQPIHNVVTYVLDQHLHPVPIGFPGELYLGGVPQARGYRNQPAKTAEKFVPDPFSNEPGKRLYKSGDLVRYRSDGKLEFIGRRDTQIKIRGFRVELGEIESTLSRHPSISQGLVTIHEQGNGLKQIVAYVVPHAGDHATNQPPDHPTDSANAGSHDLSKSEFWTEELRVFMAQTLPAHMVPELILPLSALPLLPNGKVNRRALPKPTDAEWRRNQPYVAPQTPTEQILANICMELLTLERVGINDNFFVLGGHSLLAMQVISRIHAAFHLDLPVRTIFEQTTIAELAQAIDALKAAQSMQKPIANSAAESESPEAETINGAKNHIINGFAGNDAEQAEREEGIL